MEIGQCRTKARLVINNLELISSSISHMANYNRHYYPREYSEPRIRLALEMAEQSLWLLRDIARFNGINVGDTTERNGNDFSDCVDLNVVSGIVGHVKDEKVDTD